MEKINRNQRNWMCCLQKFQVHKREKGSMSERKMLRKIEQNSEAAAFSTSSESPVVAAFSDSSSSVVAVYVEKNSAHAVQWALDNLVLEGDQLTLIHVRHPIVTVPTPMGNYMPIAQVSGDVVSDYVQKVESKTVSLLRPFQQMCNNKKVQAETIVLEDDNISMAILKYISKSRINKLVMESSPHLLTRKLKIHDMPASFAMKASKFCSVYVILNGKIASVHPSNTSAQDSSSSSLEDSLLSREPRETSTTTTDENDNLSLEIIKRDFEGPFVSKDKMWKLDETEAAFVSADEGCREYSIKQIEFATNFFSESLKIGEGGYGPVYKGSLDDTTVAIKVLRTDAAQGRHEFQQEIEVLSRIHHPNMVQLLGTCPERGCLVYEYMENGSLEDWLFHYGGIGSLPWFVRFRIASEIATALHFLHTAKPEPIVHRDLKPANILLDRNFLSKISDVGLAKLIPPTVTCDVTVYNNTVPAGTFCYMDPEYLRTGTVCPKSDIYALGIILLQLLTAKPPMALTEKVETAIEDGSFNRILDRTAGYWPLEVTIEFAELGLKCTELRRRDRPRLERVILPELQRLRDYADNHFKRCTS